MRRNALLVCLLAALGLVAIFPGPASASLVVGIGDQKPSVFADPQFRALKVKRTRYFVPWDVVTRGDGLREFDAWYRAVSAAGLEPLVAFTHAGSDRCPLRPCRLPSLRAFSQAFRAFNKRYPRIRLLQSWNEANSRTQPTYKDPVRVAQYQNEIVRICRRCKVGPDVQDLGNAYSWTAAFRRAVRKPPAFYGLHNYTDANRFRSSGTDRFVRLLGPRAKIWLTETGGIYQSVAYNGRTLLGRSDARTGKALSWLLRLARKHRTIQRIYLYNWSHVARDRWDSAIIDANGKPRSAYRVLRSQYRRYIR